MTRATETIIDEAASWHSASVRDDMDWEGFTSWLESDERHRAAYDEVAMTTALLDEHRAEIAWPQETADAQAANDDEAQGRPDRSYVARRRGWMAGLFAASLAVVLAVPQFLQSSPVVYRTQATARTIALKDGSHVVLAPHSRLSVEREQTRLALEGGAWFDVRHRPDRPLVVSAGGLEISDIGTRFDVQASGPQSRVEVAEGQLAVKGPALSAPIHLSKGRALTFDPQAGTALVADVDQRDIGEWRAGRLSYDTSPLALVAADLSRYAGVKVEVPDSLENQTFSGSLVIGNGEQAVHDLAQLMELDLHGSAGRYRVDKRR